MRISCELRLSSMTNFPTPCPKLSRFYTSIAPAALTAMLFFGCQSTPLEPPSQPQTEVSVIATLPADESGAATKQNSTPFSTGLRAAPQQERDNQTTTDSTGPQQDPALATAYDTLVKGTFFHTIPRHMHAGQQLVIRAGVGKDVNQAMLTSLDLDEVDPMTVLDDHRFDPLGMSLALVGDSTAFDIQPVSNGFKPVVQAEPEVWEWLITPTKSGTHSLKLTAIIQIDQLGNQPSEHQSLVLFDDSIPVRSVAEYRQQQLLRTFGFPLTGVAAVIMGTYIGWRLSRLQGSQIRRDRQSATLPKR